MSSTYTENNGIEKIATGAQSGTWGSTTNTNFDIIDRVSNGVGDITLSGTSHTLTTTDGVASDGHYKVLVLGGSPTGTNTITISPNDQDKLYFVHNTTDQTATFTQGSGSNVSVSAGETAIIFADGAGSGAAVTDLTSLLALPSSVTATPTELNLLDGGTSTTSTTLAGADGVVVNDNGTMKLATMDNVASFVTTDATSLDLESLDVDSITLDGSTISTNTSGSDLTLQPYSSRNIILSTDTVEMNFVGTNSSTYPRYEFFNKDLSPSANNSAGGLFFNAYDSAANIKRAYATIESEIDVVTSGSIDGKLVFSVAEDGTVASKSAPKLTVDSTTVTVQDNFVIGTSTSVDSIKDEDDMTSDSATALATQQSIKAYVDSKPSFPTVVHIPKYYETTQTGPDYKSDSAGTGNTALSITGTVPTGVTHAILSGNFIHESNGGTNNIKVSLDNGTTYTSNLSDQSVGTTPHHRQLFFSLSDAGVSAGDSYDLIIFWDASGGISNSANYAAIFDGLLTWVVT